MDVRPSRLRALRAWPAVVVSCLMLAGLFGPSLTTRGTTPSAAAAACPRGYSLYSDLQAQEARGMSAVEGEALAGLAKALNPDVCVNDNHPETANDLMAAAAQNDSQVLAPGGAVKPGAMRSAIVTRDAIARQGTSNPAWRNTWKALGVGPLITDYKDYGTKDLAIGEAAGRITDFEYVAQTKALYASVATGGVWKSTDNGGHWKAIGETLPTQVIGSVAWSSVGGGTLLVISGDNSFGRYSYEGFGAFYSTNDGKSWHHSAGIPDEAMGFKIAVDPTNPKEVYAATGAGLYRSTDAGKSFVNAKLPTGDCAGKSNRVKGCILANIVTDVVIQSPGGINEVAGGIVVAAVGWRQGNYANPDGSIQSPKNGIYRSVTGEPGTFAMQPMTGFAPQDHIGRTELGAAYGPAQDHNFLYASVQDAKLAKGALPSLDAPEGAPGLPTPPTVFNGIYSSPDFGVTWALMASAADLEEPQTGSSLSGPLTVSQSYSPGIQSWYNMWVQPDPAAADPVAGIPTRLLFGLEEVWQNELPVPMVGKQQFKVIGRYYAGNTCFFLTEPVPACPTDREDALDANTTTHPDQHTAVFIPDTSGGETLVVGNDGGAYSQKITAGQEFSNSGWGTGANLGFNTLFAYDAVLSKDGTAWFGLQDNGTGKIDPATHKVYETMGGDGFFVAVDPHNSKIAYGETTYASMAATVDGGKTWGGMTPPVTDSQFSNPFVMDPLDAKHIMTAGRQVVETGSGAGTGALDWHTDFDLGTQHHPGDASAAGTDAYGTDPPNQMTALDMVGPTAYVGFCSACDVLDNKSPFKSGIATNVGGSQPPQAGTNHGWHFAAAKGLPNRYITHVAIDPSNARIVYVTLGGYSRRWTPPGLLDNPAQVGKGNVFVSTNAGQTFTNISANLPDVRATWAKVRGDEIIVSNDVGVFVKKRSGKNWALLGKGLPNAPVHTVELSPTDLNLIVVATQGRGVWTYRFGPPRPYGPKQINYPKPGTVKGTVVAGPFTFETGEEGWTEAHTGTIGEAGVTVVEQSGQWRRQPPGNASAFSFAVLPYTDKATALLYSPRINNPAAGTVEVSWAELRDTEACCDFMTLDWSQDGLVWNSVESAAGFNGDAAPLPNPDDPTAWDPTQYDPTKGFPSFTPASAKFYAPKGPIYIRFRLTSDDLVSFPANLGAAVDDITVKV